MVFKNARQFDQPVVLTAEADSGCLRGRGRKNKKGTSAQEGLSCF